MRLFQDSIIQMDGLGNPISTTSAIKVRWIVAAGKDELRREFEFTDHANIEDKVVLPGLFDVYIKPQKEIHQTGSIRG